MQLKEIHMRPSGRAVDQMRAVSLELDVARHAEGSCLVRFGHTHVLCTASIEERVPPFLRNTGKGWVTAEYGMLPRATNTRIAREAARGKQSGRTQEIQRLIGRSLRAVTRLDGLGERQVIVDCDVLQADGGTRTASITGAYVALHQALAKLVANAALPRAAAARAGGGRVVRDRRRHRRARPRLCRGQQCPGRRQLRALGLGRHRRGPGDRRGHADRPRAVRGDAAPGRQRHRRPGRAAAAGARS